jgi:hypothetical protein
MSKRRMLKLFEVINERGRPNLVVTLPGQLHSQSGSLLPWTTQKPPRTRSTTQIIATAASGSVSGPKAELKQH